MSSRYGRDTIVEINLDAVKHNVSEFEKCVNDENIVMMVTLKVNGYGHGSVEVS